MIRQVVKVLFSLLLLRLQPEERRKILLIAEYGKSGGTRTYFIYLLHFLHSQGYNVTVLFNGDKEDEEIDHLILKYSFNRLQVTFDFWCIDMDEVPEGHTKAKLIRRQLTEILFWCSLQRQHKFSAFIFSVSNPEQYLYAFLLPAKITYILHTAIGRKKADKYKRLLLKWCLGAKKRILTVSLFARQSVEHFWLDDKSSKHVNFVYNYYVPKYPVKINGQARSVKKVLTIGSVEAYKNPLLFVETAKAVITANKGQAIEFVWAGDGRLLNTCKQASSDFPQIQFIGRVENVEQLYAEATVYYQPSLLESHGIAVLGAMYHRLPCVVSDHGGLKESVVDGKSGYVVPVKDKNASVESINRLLRDQSVGTEMGEHGYSIYLRKFTKQVWEEEMKSCFNNL